MSEPTSEQSLFLQAIALTSPTERAAYLDDACRDTPKLRAELDALLAAHAPDDLSLIAEVKELLAADAEASA